MVTEKHIVGLFHVPACGADSNSRLNQVCSVRRLFLVYTRFCYKNWYRLTWPSPSVSQHPVSDWPRCLRSPVISISRRQPSLPTSVNSNHSLVRARFYWRLVCGCTNKKAIRPTQLLSEIYMPLALQWNAEDSIEHWEPIKTLHAATDTTQKWSYALHDH